MKFILKVSPEITIKSKFVRKDAVKKLVRNIEAKFKLENLDCRVISMRDKIEVIAKQDFDDVKLILKRIPGLAHFLEVTEFDLEGIEKDDIFSSIFNTIKEYYLPLIEGKTFVVRVKRSWAHDFTSIDLERYLWGGLLKYSENAKVKLKNPEVTVKLEVKDLKYYIIKNKTEGVWGYPVWFQDKVLSLISWWFDSWVSTYNMMKRWCKVDFLFFNLGWSAHELGVKQVAYYLWTNFWIWHDSKFITIPFEEVIKELLTKANHKYRWILLKRYMLRIASKFPYYYALVKWDSLWQVSSQTLKNMHVIDKASDNLVLRPLISSNKQEIVDITKEIGTYNFAANMPEYCWVISDKPATWATMKQVLDEEKNIDTSILETAFLNKKIEKIKDIIENELKENNIEVSVLPGENEIVIDVREEDKIKKDPLVLESTEILNIPFFDINSKFKSLDSSKVYLLYCDKWILSKLHAEYLIEKWYENIKIFRPSWENLSCQSGL